LAAASVGHFYGVMGERRPSRWWYALLALPLLGLLYPPLYARNDPELAGIPFFYWYQFAWVFGAVAITIIVYVATSRR
jgi:hypothetical protein